MISPPAYNRLIRGVYPRATEQPILATLLMSVAILSGGL